MKTIKERAEEYQLEQAVKPCEHIDGYYSGKDIEDAYTAGATEQKAIMLEEAIKGFEEFWSAAVVNPEVDDVTKGFHRMTFQAATLSKMKEIELKDEANNLLSESFFNAKGEIEELKNNVSFAIKYMEAHNYQNYAPYEPENQMYASLKNALNAIK